MVKRAVLFTNGDLGSVPRIEIKSDDLVIGIDGGTELAQKIGRTPDLIIGDLDSLKKAPENIPLLRYPRDKDFTDTELAVDFCRELGIKDLILVGFLGRRLDHMLANLFLAANLKLTVIEGDQILYFVDRSLNLTGNAGDLVSLIPLSDCDGVTTEGLQWRLQGSTLKVGESRGVSNVMIDKTARISLRLGRLLVVKT